MKSLTLKLISFLGKELTLLTLANSLVGIIVFATEASFVFILQIFLVNLGLLNKEFTFLPEYIPTSPLSGFIILTIFGILRGFVAIAKLYLSVKTQQSFIINRRIQLLKQALLFGGKVSTKELTTSFSELTTQGGEVIKQLSQFITSGISAMLFFLYGLYLAPKEMITGFILLSIISLPFKSISRKISSAGKDLTKSFSSVNESLLRGIRNNYFIRLYSLQDREIELGVEHLKSYEKSYLKYGKAVSIMGALPSLSGAIIVAFLAFLGTQYFHTPGIKLIAFFYIFMRFAQSVSDLIQILSFIKLNLDGFKMLYQWSIKEDRSIPTNYSQNKINENSPITIKAKNLSFNYSGKNIFSNLDFNLNQGDVFLIKGESGSGKTTLLNVILGLYKPSTGSIEYNDAANIPSNISDFIGYVGPEAYTISGSFRENLTYGFYKEVTDQEVWEALKKAKLDNTVEALPNKLNEPVLDSADLSTGQKQRLAIARAVLRSPKILVLDEATSNLDNQTERDVIQSIKSISKDLIIIVISHRDSFDSIATQRLSMGKNEF